MEVVIIMRIRMTELNLRRLAVMILLVVAAVGAISLAFYRPRRKDGSDRESVDT